MSEYTSNSSISSGEENASTTLFECAYTDNLSMDVFDLVNSSLVPFALMLVFSSLTISFVFRSRRKVTSVASAAAAATAPTVVSSTTTTTGVRRRDMRFAAISSGLNVLFLALTLPFVLYCWLSDGPYTPYYILDTLYALNFSLTFPVCVAFNSMFRLEFVEMMFGPRRRRALTHDASIVQVATRTIAKSKA